MTDYEIRCYRILYRFLKEYGLMSNYLENIVVKSHRPRANAKEMLTRLVKDYISTYGCSTHNSASNIFNWAPSSFYWDCSIEGTDFWYKSFKKWARFYNKHKEEYNLVGEVIL